MPDTEHISDDEMILRRIPPSGGAIESVVLRGGVLTATSAQMELKAGEKGLSVSQRKLTSPNALLALLHSKGISPEGWMVVELKVGDVRSLGLEVESDPTDEDPGHCLIVPSPDCTFSPSMRKKLAKFTRLVVLD